MSDPAQAGFSCTEADFSQIAAIVGDEASAQTICSTYDVSGLGPTDAVLKWMVTELRSAELAVQETKHGLDTAFVLTSAYQVFVMQIGFALYAAGVIRAKNIVAIFMKSFSDACLAALVMYILGYALQYGKGSHMNGFIGTSDFVLTDTANANPEPYHLWVWNWAFAAAATTILSGSIAERATYLSYVIYCLWITAWVYPVVVHWFWSTEGWLSAYRVDPLFYSGSIDFAGSGVVHLVGGTAALIACTLLGPRVGRFDHSLPERSFRGVSPPLYLMGTFLLWFGWYGFNPGSKLSISNFASAAVVSRCAINTTLAPGMAAISTLMLVFYRNRTWDLLAVCTGAIAGLVGITAGCSVLEPWAAIIVGLFCGPIYIYSEEFLVRIRIDDAISAFPVHGACGMWGLLFVGFLAKKEYIEQAYAPRDPEKNVQGVFYGGHGHLLACQVLAIVMIFIWTAINMFILFYMMYKLGLLRVRPEYEAMGLDQAVMGASGVDGAIDPRSSVSKLGSMIKGAPPLLPLLNAVPLKDLPIKEDPHLEPALIYDNVGKQANHAGNNDRMKDTGPHRDAGGLVPMEKVKNSQWSQPMSNMLQRGPDHIAHMVMDGANKTRTFFDEPGMPQPHFLKITTTTTTSRTATSRGSGSPTSEFEHDLRMRES